jgi:glycosyltransferase involved in cell wall biosynthesis
VYPWPADDGYRQRLAQMISALGEAGEVDFLCVAGLPANAEAPPADLRMVRIQPRRLSPVDRGVAWLRRGLPRSQLITTAEGVEDEARQWIGDRSYDVAYFSHIHSWLLFHHLVDCPTVVDFNDLGHLVIRSARLNDPVGAGVAGRAKWLARQAVDRIDERRMERLEHRCAGAVEAVTVCSRLDVARSGVPNASAIANGYERSGDAPARRDGATFLFVGALGYPPNADAARWFVREVFPAVRARRSDAQVRIVGREPQLVHDLAEVDGVEVLGRVPDMAVELAGATVAVVPIRFGSGTRLKVVEALANRLPLVATTIGVEGIDVVDGQHALLADDAEGFARACLRLLEEPALRSAIADEGESLWDERYRWSTIRRDLAALVTRVGQPETESRTTAGE